MGSIKDDIIEKMRYLKNLKNFSGKTVLLRTDFNIEAPKDALRLESSLPTLRFFLKNGARVVILSHRGRPSKKPRTPNLELRTYDFHEPELSLKIVIPFLQKQLKNKIVFLKDIPKRLPAGKLFLLENLRFWEGEDKNDLRFARKLAQLGDFYVNDAFAVSHRKNASITQLPKILSAYAGLLLEKELGILSGVMKNPKKPLVLIFGGSKMEDKLPVIKNLLSKADKVLLGSAVVNNGDLVPKSSKIIKPIDWIGEKGAALDIGSLTVNKYAGEIKKAKTIIWNGPLGKFEDQRFAGGSIAIAKMIVKSKAFSVIGGGETTQLIIGLGLRKKIGFLSTGGGAMLAFLAGEKLPGIEALVKSKINPPAGGQK